MSHPITPSPELVEQWMQVHTTKYDLAREAAQWGADQELEACLGEVSFLNSRALADRVRAARRPKPPSLKEQALTALTRYTTGETILTNESVDTIRRALESIPDPSY